MVLRGIPFEIDVGGRPCQRASHEQSGRSNYCGFELVLEGSESQAEESYFPGGCWVPRPRAVSQLESMYLMAQFWENWESASKRNLRQRTLSSRIKDRSQARCLNAVSEPLVVPQARNSGGKYETQSRR